MSYCRRCDDRGGFIAWNKTEMDAGPYCFKCPCLGGGGNANVPGWLSARRLPEWDMRHEPHFVTQWQDPLGPPDHFWLKSQVDAGATQSPAFQDRMKLWGRDRFEKIWLELKSDPSKLKEGLG